MYQPEPAAYIPVSTGYGIDHGHGLPEYTFQETPLGLGSGGSAGLGLGGGGGGGVGVGNSGGGGPSGGGYSGGLGNSGTIVGATGARSGGAGAGAAGAALIYTTPIFNAANPATGIGPASGPFTFHHHQQQQQQHTGHPHNNNFNQTLSQHSRTTTRSANRNHQSSSSSSSHNTRSRVKMEPNADDLAAQEAAAREYQPQTKGPLVGEKTPSTAITEEYAKGDPIYVQKTMALPQTYSHYRRIQGDGNCGWRAVGFGYFETLITRGDKAQIEAEKLRMEALDDYIEKVGEMSPFVFQDMTEETIALLQRISVALPDREQAMSALMAAFNDQAISDSIIYHFRLLASSWLKGNRDQYSAFVDLDTGIEGYCETTIQQHSREIEHLGLVLLVNVLLKPVGFVLEVAYLDRSPGAQVNTFRFPEEATGQHPSTLGSMIHLLYRPDHYDMLYPVQVNSTIQVHRVDTSFPSFMPTAPVALPDYSAPDLQTLSLIPGFGAPAAGYAPLGEVTTTGSPLTSYTSSSPGSTWMPSPFTDPSQQQAATPVPVAVTAAAPTPAQQNHPLRFNKYCQLPEYVENDTWKEPTFQTSTFRNSHFNVAHYNNPNFQPEEYKPGAEECELPVRSSGRKRGSV